MGLAAERIRRDSLREVSIREVGPREGFQRNAIIKTEDKVRVINLLLAAGINKIQAVSFTNPKLVPNWADAEEVLERIDYSEGVWVEGLCLNDRGVERAIATRHDGRGVNEVLFLFACTDSILKKNGLPWTVDDMLRDALPRMVGRAKEAGLRVVVSISGAFGCAMEGYVAPDRPVSLVHAVKAMGADEAHIGDSTGEASPIQIVSLFERLREELPDYPLAAHFHNNRGICIANLFALVEAGIPGITFDTGIGELGGSPFAGGAGNLSTEDVVVMLESMGVETGIDPEKLMVAAHAVAELYDFPMVSHTVHYGLPRWWSQAPPRRLVQVDATLKA